VTAKAPTQPNQPYMRIETYLQHFAADHVTFIDPKGIATGAQIEALLDVMDASGGPSRFVAKYYGVVPDGPTASWMGRAKARGYKTWGFFYDTDSPANISTYAPKWTYVGLNYNAPDAAAIALAAAAQPGAKLIAHITPTAAAVNQARAWTPNVHGFMVSGVVPVDVANNVRPD